MEKNIIHGIRAFITITIAAITIALVVILGYCMFSIYDIAYFEVTELKEELRETNASDIVERQTFKADSTLPDAKMRWLDKNGNVVWESSDFYSSEG